MLAGLRLDLHGIETSIRWRGALSRCKRRWQTAVSVFRMMLRWAEPDSTHLNAVLSACVASKEWRKGMMMIERMSAANLEPDVFSITTMLGHAATGKWTLALALLSFLDRRHLQADRIAYGEVLKSYNRGSLWTLSLLSLARMSEVNMHIDEVSVAHFMNTCMNWQLAVHSMKRITGSTNSRSLLHFNIAQSSYGEANWRLAAAELEKAHHNRMHPDEISFCTSLKKQHWLLAIGSLRVLSQMKARQLRPNINCYNCIARRCWSNSDSSSCWLTVLEILSSVQQQLIRTDTVTLNTCLGALQKWQLLLGLASSSDVEADAVTWLSVMDAFQFSHTSWMMSVDILSQLRARQTQPSKHMKNAVMKCCKGTGRWRLPFSLLSRSSDQSDHSASIANCATSACWQLAVYLMNSERLGLQQDVVSLNSCSSVLDKSHAWSQAVALLRCVSRQQLQVSQESQRASVSACGTAAGWEQAAVCWDNLRASFSPDVASCNTALSATESGGWHQTLFMWKTLRRAHFQPDDISYNVGISC